MFCAANQLRAYVCTERMCTGAARALNARLHCPARPSRIYNLYISHLLSFKVIKSSLLFTIDPTPCTYFKRLAIYRAIYPLHFFRVPKYITIFRRFFLNFAQISLHRRNEMNNKSKNLLFFFHTFELVVNPWKRKRKSSFLFTLKCLKNKSKKLKSIAKPLGLFQRLKDDQLRPWRSLGLSIVYLVHNHHTASS